MWINGGKEDMNKRRVLFKLIAGSVGRCHKFKAVADSQEVAGKFYDGLCHILL